MIRSMTGFGQALRQSNGYKIQVDIKSVNHRYCEINIRMPREWIALEASLKKTIQRVIKRGKVDVFVSIERDAEAERSFELNWKLVEKLMLVSDELSRRFSLADNMAAKDLLLFPEVLVWNEPNGEVMETVKREVQECLNDALSYLMLMREAEGKHLYADLVQRLHRLEQEHKRMVELAPQAVEEYREKLRQRMNELFHNVSLDEQRLAMEVALHAERTNIEEELTRLQSHFLQFRHLLEDTEPVGRKLDFLLQEMNREANTIAAKSSHLEMSNWAVNMKAELETLREQVQNIE